MAVAVVSGKLDVYNQSNKYVSNKRLNDQKASFSANEKRIDVLAKAYFKEKSYRGVFYKEVVRIENKQRFWLVMAVVALILFFPFVIIAGAEYMEWSQEKKDPSKKMQQSQYAMDVHAQEIGELEKINEGLVNEFLTLKNAQ